MSGRFENLLLIKLKESAHNLLSPVKKRPYRAFNLQKFSLRANEAFRKYNLCEHFNTATDSLKVQSYDQDTKVQANNNEVYKNYILVHVHCT